MTAPCSGLVSTASATFVHTGGWSVGYGEYRYHPADTAQLARCDVSQRLHVRLSAPATAMTINGTVYFQETGKGYGV